MDGVAGAPPATDAAELMSGVTSQRLDVPGVAVPAAAAGLPPLLTTGVTSQREADTGVPDAVGPVKVLRRGVASAAPAAAAVVATSGVMSQRDRDDGGAAAAAAPAAVDAAGGASQLVDAAGGPSETSDVSTSHRRRLAVPMAAVRDGKRKETVAL